MVQGDEIERESFLCDVTHELVQPITWHECGVEDGRGADLQPGSDEEWVQVDGASDGVVIYVWFAEAEDMGISGYGS